METNVKESITINSMLEPILIHFKMNITEKDGKKYPKIEVISNTFKIMNGTIVINAKGDMPQFKMKKFDKGIKDWLSSTDSVREAEFKKSLENSLNDIFPDVDKPFSGRDLKREKLMFNHVTTGDIWHHKDVKIVYDDNQINHFLYTMLYVDKPFSLSDTMSDVIISMLPETL